MVTLQELADDLRRTIRFRYLTADKYGVKLWSERPRYFQGTRSWGGSETSWCGAVADAALPDVSISADDEQNIVRAYAGTQKQEQGA